MGKVRELADQLWNGALSTENANPLTTFLGLEEWADGVAFVSSFANVTAFGTADGLVLVDTGGFLAAGAVHGALRAWSRAPLHTAIYTHGHVDHVFGVAAFDAEAASGGPRVIAHEGVPARFDRYRLTAGYNAHINARQFRFPGLRWPTDYRYPDATYRDRLDLEVGGIHFELHHDRGETDDHTWVWVPEHRALCTGDLFIWASPNCGNPQKVQRYPREWAAALRKMAALQPAVLFPGHGPPITGADRVALALDETARLLEHICERTLELMNQGKRLDDVVAGVDLPADLLARPYLRPVYDDPSFIVRTLGVL
jgi:glyoxylase-like metal-dependent hydrolase (beta-lactamase superfamily II)